jgi:hypothetical protein
VFLARVLSVAHISFTDISAVPARILHLNCFRGPWAEVACGSGAVDATRMVTIQLWFQIGGGALFLLTNAY